MPNYVRRYDESNVTYALFATFSTLTEAQSLRMSAGSAVLGTPRSTTRRIPEPHFVRLSTKGAEWRGEETHEDVGTERARRAV